MLKKTKDDIYAKAKELWPAAEDIDVAIYPDRVEIRLSSMYSSPPLNLPLLMKLSEFFKTTNINDDHRFSHQGCETCDYGSSYGFTLTVRPEE